MDNSILQMVDNTSNADNADNADLHIKIKILEHTVEQLVHKITILEERIRIMEYDRYRHARTPSFLTGDPFVFPPNQG